MLSMGYSMQNSVKCHQIVPLIFFYSADQPGSTNNENLQKVKQNTNILGFMRARLRIYIYIENHVLSTVKGVMI